MKRVLHRRPSASMVVAITALVVALGGTAIAASHLAKGDNLIKKRSLSGNRLKNHTITGTQVNMNRLGKVKSAANADHATLADSAATATSATTASAALEAANATNATNAANAAKFGGLLPASFQGSLPWALFQSDGTILAQSGGISLLAGFTGGTGAYVGFPQHLKGVMVTGAYTSANTGGQGTPIAELCGGATGLIHCNSGPDDTTEAFVRTFTTADVATPEPFMIVGIP